MVKKCPLKYDSETKTDGWCDQEECAWWDGANSECSLRSVARNLEKIGSK